MKSFWNKLFGRDAATHRAEELQQESPAERAFSTERIEDHAADEAVEEHLGGFNPERLADDE
jgi:hypothetical protein